jgi:hypothetical protein
MTMRSCISGILLAVAATALPPAGAAAQLRPVDPVEWHVFDDGAEISLALGMGVLWQQHASLAGTKGTLLELGNFYAAWRTGRVVLELAGTMQRRFDDRVVVRAPEPGADPPNGHWRHDAGDVRASTLVRLTGVNTPALLVLRFGTRLPTTSEEAGLDRDRTDFFATIGGRWHRGALSVAGESGIGIHGTRLDGYDQSDVWTYSLAVELDVGPLTPTAALVGHKDGLDSDVRGNEDLNELRLGMRAGARYWVQAAAVLGLAEFSPGGGLLLMFGFRP